MVEYVCPREKSCSRDFPLEYVALLAGSKVLIGIAFQLEFVNLILHRSGECRSLLRRERERE